MTTSGSSYEVTPFAYYGELACDILVRMIPMRDNTRLHTIIYLPPGMTRPTGTVLWRTPYFRREHLPLPDTFALQHGFAAVYQSCRGTACSEGEFFPTCQELEEHDGEDTINWILQQPWSNGRIALMGSSYSGRTQWAAAFSGNKAITGLKPHVAALRGCTSMANKGGGCSHGFMISWCLSMHHRNKFGHDNIPDYDAQLDHLPVHEMDHLWGYDVIPFYRDFIRTCQKPATATISMDDRFRQVMAPALISGGWFDGFLQENIESFHLMKTLAGSPQARDFTRLVIGPWVHSGLANKDEFGEENDHRDLLKVQDDFTRGCLMNPDTDPVPEQPVVQYFMMGKNCWMSSQTWPPEHKLKTFFLQENGALAEQPSDRQDAFSSYIYDPASPTPSFNGKRLAPGYYDRRETEKRKDLLVFTTPVLRKPLAVAGNVRVRLWAESSAPDTDFFATLSDVDPEGRSMFLKTGMVRARFSKSLERADFLTPGEIREYEIDLGDIANTFLPGHAVRLVIHSANFPAHSRNLNTRSPIQEGIAMVQAQQKILHSSQYPSCLLLPELQQAGEQE